MTEADTCRTFILPKLHAADLLKYDEAVYLVSVNLDLKNPSRVDEFEHLPPEQLAADIAAKEARIAEIVAEIAELLGRAI